MLWSRGWRRAPSTNRPRSLAFRPAPRVSCSPRTRPLQAVLRREVRERHRLPRGGLHQRQCAEARRDARRRRIVHQALRPDAHAAAWAEAPRTPPLGRASRMAMGLFEFRVDHVLSPLLGAARRRLWRMCRPVLRRPTALVHRGCDAMCFLPSRSRWRHHLAVRPPSSPLGALVGHRNVLLLRVIIGVLRVADEKSWPSSAPDLWPGARRSG